MSLRIAERPRERSAANDRRSQSPRKTAAAGIIPFEPKPFEPEPNDAEPSPSADHTVVIRIRKEGDKYTAYPMNIPVLHGVANVVFVLENAPANARFERIQLEEDTSPAKKTAKAKKNGNARPLKMGRRKPPKDFPNPFSFPASHRVMLLTDDNTKSENQHRHFAYWLKVYEGKKLFWVDPGIDNDPPPGGGP